jgi:hypothetical protein
MTKLNMRTTVKVAEQHHCLHIWADWDVLQLHLMLKLGLCMHLRRKPQDD